MVKFSNTTNDTEVIDIEMSISDEDISIRPLLNMFIQFVVASSYSREALVQAMKGYINEYETK